MKREWTDEQKEAIYTKWQDDEKKKSSNILVNAAAGSGKTAVLVERIINKLCADASSQDRCDANRLLVVTFTNAAAREMQQRITEALTKRYQKAVEENDAEMAENLKKQLSLIHLADITTIDSYCLKLVKNYFHLLCIDPDFKIVDSAECELLKDEAMEELFETYYNDEEFIRLVCLYSESRDDTGLAKLIKQIFDFTRSQPDPDGWLDEKTESQRLCEEENPYFKTVINIIRERAGQAMEIYASALCSMVDTVRGRKQNYTKTELEEIIKSNPPESENDLHFSFGILYKIMFNEYFLAKSLCTEDWDTMHERLSGFRFERLNAPVKLRDKEQEICDPEITEPIKQKRTAAKKIISDAIKPFLACKKEEINKITDEFVYPVTKLLVKYCRLFAQIYQRKKTEKNIREFSDIEHLCLRLLCENAEVREELKEKYVEILMDEYQDSNALQEAIFEKISRGDNTFIVGDMKQSIYRFRSSDPDLFKTKCDFYKKEKGAENKKIILSRNFRSRQEVLDGINSVFEKVMSESVGGVLYDEDQRLYCGDKSYEKKNEGSNGGNKCECFAVLAPDDEEENITAKICEARFVAKKIKQMCDEKYQVRDKRKVTRLNEQGEPFVEDELYYRDVRPGDFAIIMSSYKNNAAVFCKELSACGIECYAQTGGYFDRPEIKLALALLKTINNPYNDIPLIAVLRSPVFSFTDDDLCRVRTYSGGSFYDAVKSAAEGSEKVSDMCRDFLEKLENWRYYTKIMSCDKLLWTLYEQTSLYSFCGAVYGEEAATNLRLLFARARSYEKFGYKGLFNFIRYIDKMKKKQTDLSTAVLAGENSDVVRIMTIHKSKGLEFPVVFFSCAANKFNKDDIKGKILLHKDLGMGADYIDFEKSFSVPTLQKMAVKEKIKEDMLSEEMRKLYVALTRAKEKLIVTAATTSVNTDEFAEKTPSKYEAWKAAMDDGKIRKSAAKKAESFIDWIAPVAINDTDNWNFNVVTYDDLIKEENIEPLENACTDEKKNKASISICDYIYPYIALTKIPVKLSVSDLKNAYLSDNFTALFKEPEFLTAKTGLSPAQKGTAVHLVMQKFIPFEGMRAEDIREFINTMCEKNELTAEEAMAVDENVIFDFYASDLGQRIIKSDRVVREAPFEIEVPVNEIYDINSDEKIIIQGVIDCYFYEGDEIVIVDYKTDYYTDIEQIEQKYSIQLQYYRMALEKICKKPIKNVFLYLFFGKSVIEYQSNTKNHIS